MNRNSIPFEELNYNTFKLWTDWLVLTAGIHEPGKFNPMTISWGTMGFMWQKPVIMVGVRPSRYTYEFIEKYDTFTVCAFPATYQKTALTLMGTKSGREIDKVKESGLTPFASTQIAAPGFAEAELILECKKVYFDDLTPSNAAPSVEEFYHGQDYHRVYIGEILAVYGTSKYQRHSASE